MGHHHFNDVWPPIVGEVLQCYLDERNRYDRNADRQGACSILLVAMMRRIISEDPQKYDHRAQEEKKEEMFLVALVQGQN